MDVEVIFEWTFTPPDCLEQRIDVTTADYRLTIDSAKATAKLEPAYYAANPGVKDLLHREILSRLRGAQLLTDAPCDLTGPVVIHVQEDGSRRHHLDCLGGAFVIAGGSLDICLRDKDGRVIRDTRRERLADKAALGDLIAKHYSDTTLQAMLRGYDNAIRDRNDELVHLYEIRDALASHFSGESAACQAIGVSHAEWSRMGSLCNDKRLRQGRHRGKKDPLFRDATTQELEEARSIAKSMIRRYLDYLERGQECPPN